MFRMKGRLYDGALSSQPPESIVLLDPGVRLHLSPVPVLPCVRGQYPRLRPGTSGSAFPGAERDRGHGDGAGARGSAVSRQHTRLQPCLTKVLKDPGLVSYRRPHPKQPLTKQNNF